jgi:hypothetical protein
LPGFGLYGIGEVSVAECSQIFLKIPKIVNREGIWKIFGSFCFYFLAVKL